MMKKIVKDVRSAVLFLAFKRKVEWSFILPLLLLSLVFLTNAEAKEPLPMPEGPAVSVDAVEVETFEPVFQPSEDGPAPRPNHPPFDQIPPMPMPEPSEIDKEIDSSGPVGICYPDPVTGETVCVEVPDSSRLADETVRVPGYDGADGGSGDMEEPPTIVDMTKVSSLTSSFPRKNAKLIMRFVDALNRVWWGQCSGTMIDAETVQTAGHCIYDHEDNLGWATDVWVYPAWDGNGGLDNPPPSIINHYGYGHSTNLRSTVGWVNYENLDDDLGVVGINRAVGMLTGWHARERGPDCDGIKPDPHYNYSYPAECCNWPSCTLHNGRDMYYWSGHFDSCPGNQLQVNLDGTCFNGQWGGQSGSGTYRVFEGKGYLRAVCSHRIGDFKGYYCRLWNWWIDDTDNYFIPKVRGSSFDLQALDVDVEPSTIRAGSKTTLLEHLATNPTNGSSSYANRTFRVYLSSNDNITPSDTLLGTYAYSRSFGPMQSYRVGTPQVTIPANTPPGNYFIGVIYDSSTDSNYGNNDTTGWDAAPILVTEASPTYDEIIGTWNNGIWYFEPPYWYSGQMYSSTPNGASPSGDIEAGDTNGDGVADVASCWKTGLWLQNGSTRGWERVSPATPNKVTMANVTGDARKEIVATYANSLNYYYRTSSGWAGRLITNFPPSGDISAGDITGDGFDEVVSSFKTGTWYWNPSNGNWKRITNSVPYNLACGDLTGDGRAEVVGGFNTGVWSWDQGKWSRLTSSGWVCYGDMEIGDFNRNGRDDLVTCWPGLGMFIRFDYGAWKKVYGVPPYRVTTGNIINN